MKRVPVRANEHGAFGLLSLIVFVVVLLVVAVVVIGGASNPTRAKNDCGKDAVSYARSSGSYNVSAFLGDPHGEFSLIKIDVTSIPSEGSGPNLPFGMAMFGKSGDVHVEISVTGPGGVSIADWRSVERSYDFPLSDQASGGSRPGDFLDGLTCFKEHGTSSWHFALVWEGADGFNKVLDTEDRVVNV